MRRIAAAAALLAGLAAGPALSQAAQTGVGGILRVLDKSTGITRDVELRNGEERTIGLLTIRLTECRYPADNPSGDAYPWLTITYDGQVDPVFRGWMIASAPAVSAMEHPRYDVWALRCITS